MDASLCLSEDLLGLCFHISLPVPYNPTREDMGSIQIGQYVQQTKKNCTDPAQEAMAFYVYHLVLDLTSGVQCTLWPHCQGALQVWSGVKVLQGVPDLIGEVWA